MKYAFYIVLIVAIVLAFFQWKSCNKEVVLPDNKVRDSSLYAKIDSLRNKIVKDSLTFEALRQEDDNDREGILNDKQRTESALTNQVVQLTFQRNKFQAASLGKDTASAMEACREFITKAEQFYADGLKYKAAFDSAVANSAERRRIDSSERGLVYQGIIQDGITIDTLKVWYHNADSSFRKAAAMVKKVDKRLGIGISAGATYYNNGLKPYIGIGINYNLIRLK